MRLVSRYFKINIANQIKPNAIIMSYHFYAKPPIYKYAWSKDRQIDNKINDIFININK